MPGLGLPPPGTVYPWCYLFSAEEPNPALPACSGQGGTIPGKSSGIAYYTYYIIFTERLPVPTDDGGSCGRAVTMLEDDAEMAMPGAEQTLAAAPVVPFAAATADTD